MQSIFSEENKVKTSSNFFKFDKVQDKVEGTLIDIKTIYSNLLKADQKLYELLLEDGSTVVVGGKKGIDMQMSGVNLGQIVGFHFVQELPPKVVGHSPTKVIQVFANSTYVNKEWLETKDKESLTKDFNLSPEMIK